jgi:hypothetical protein
MDSTFEHNDDTGFVSMMKQKEMIIELYQMPQKELAEIKNRDNGHIDHIAFDVDDIDKVFMELKSDGFIIIEKQPVFLSFWKKGCKYFNITGPD